MILKGSVIKRESNKLTGAQYLFYNIGKHYL